MEHLEMDLCFHIDQLGVGESFGKGFFSTELNGKDLLVDRKVIVVFTCFKTICYFGQTINS